MKKIHDYLIISGITLVTALSLALVHAQAPEPMQPAEPEVEAPAPLDAAQEVAPQAAAPVVPEVAAEPDEDAPEVAMPELPVVEPAVARPAAPLPGAAAGNNNVLNRLRAQQAAPRVGDAAAPAAPNPLRMIRPASARDLAADAVAGVIEPSDGAGDGTKPPPGLKFNSTAVDIVLMAYAEETGKTLLMAPDVPKANITLNSQPGVILSRDEFVEAIEVVLSMHGIVLEPYGDKFVKVLARKTVRTDGIKIVMTPPEGGHPEKSQVVSQMIRPKYIAIEEAKKAIEGFKKPDGMIQTFERTNSLLVTDTQENVNRMLEIILFIDQPIAVTEDVHVVVVNFAKAEDIKKRIEELVAESQKATAKDEVTAKPSGSPGIVKTAGTTSSIAERLSRLRSPQPAPVEVTPNEALDTMISDADRGMIRGKVQIIADERTNKLIIITNKDNMAFFERIITVLDVETAPDVKVEVMRLEYADAEEVSTMLNDLIGNATAKKEDSNAAAGKAPAASAATRSTSLAEAAAARGTATSDAAPGVSKLGQLSKDSIKILADKRTNALVMMGSIGDLAAITEIVKSMDIMLSQVLIETVVLEVSLSDKIDTGINWIRRINNGDDYRYTVGGGGTAGEGTANLFASEKETTEVAGPPDADGNPTTETITKVVGDMAGNYLEGMANPVSGLEYFMTFKNLRLDAVIKASQSDSRARVLSSPVLLTVDNKEATIEATELQYMYKGMRYMGYSGTQGGGSYEPDIEQRDVGLTVKVTPRISPNGNVILTVEETFEQVLGAQIINGQAWPTITSRKLSADVSVGNGATVVLGGLIQSKKSDSQSGIPILKDIPYIGKYLFGSTSKEEKRSEMLVFLTPYVIENDEDMRKEARRRKDYLDATDIWTKGWSDSELADPVPTKEMSQRLERKKALEKRWQEYGAALEASNEVDGRISEEREKVMQVFRGEPDETNSAPPSSGVMKVQESVVNPAGDTPPLEEDPDVEPQRPAIEEKRSSWFKRLFQ
ncbi:MAG: type II secretion system secretin GspD [Kiritimatiellae bacterium]|nr:type II secretion system secretin GspD [Kiritimatiellia bacterium]